MPLLNWRTTNPCHYSITIFRHSHAEKYRGRRKPSGKQLFDLADFSTVWNLAEVFEYGISALRIGQRVTMSIAAYPGETFRRKIRLYFTHTERHDSHGECPHRSPEPTRKTAPRYVQHNGTDAKSPAITVPEESVILSGRQAVVWVQESKDDRQGKGVFRAQSVTLGVRSGGKYQVLSGLHEGDIVAASGGFCWTLSTDCAAERWRNNPFYQCHSN